jgi:hypothetical protein
MNPFMFRPPLFLLTGLLWLFASSLLGLVVFLSMVLGIRLPPVLRVLHVHGALIGGVAQMILGAMLAFIPPLLMSGRGRSESHPVLYAFINVGTIAVLSGFAMRDYTWVGVSGFLVIVAFVSLFAQGVRQARGSLVSPPLNLWFYGVAVLALLGGLSMGEALAWQLVSPGGIGQTRLAHIHLNLLGFITLTIVGTMHNLFPTVVNTRLHSGRLAQMTFFLLPLGIVLLIAGFLLSALWVQIAAGIVVLAGVAVYGYNVARTWIDAGRPSTAAIDHLLIGTLFLAMMIPIGILVSANYLWHPPLVPFGTLHLVAYTHLALIGFILQTTFGALSHLLPISLAVSRVPSNKKRGAYLDRLTRITERWRVLQVGSLSLGTVALTCVAALVWQFNLSSPAVLAAAWATAALLLLGLTIFGAKVVALLFNRPPSP